MEQNSQDIRPVSTLQEPYDNNNNSMFYGLPLYQTQSASNLGAGMSTTSHCYHPYANFYSPPSYLLSSGSHGAVMEHGYKRKSAEVTQAAPCSYPHIPETTHFIFPQFGTYPQPLDQRSMQDRPGGATMDHNNYIQGNFAAHPFPPPGSTWYDHRSDGSSSPWSQSPFAPYMHGNIVTSSIDSGNVCFPRYYETSSSRNPAPFVYPTHHYISHHPVPPPATVYPPMASASYSHVGPVQSTGFRINQQHPTEDFVPAAILRYHLRATPADEVGVLEVEDFYDQYQDMRLDIEDMSYEELLALSDQIGTVKTGLSEEDVEDLLTRRTSLSTRINLEEAPCTNLETDSCTICQENYNNQDKIVTLDCRHEYHAECLKKWLVIKNVCPNCKSEALVMEKKKAR